MAQSTCKTAKGESLTPERAEFLDRLLMDNWDWIIVYGGRCARGQSPEEREDAGLELVTATWLAAHATIARWPEDKPLPGPEPVSRNAWIRAVARNIVNQNFRLLYREGWRGGGRGPEECVEVPGRDPSGHGGESIPEPDEQCPGTYDFNLAAQQAEQEMLSHPSTEFENPLLDQIAARQTLHEVWPSLNGRHQAAIYLANQEEVEMVFPEQVPRIKERAAEYEWNTNAHNKAVYDARHRAKRLQTRAVT